MSLFRKLWSVIYFITYFVYEFLKANFIVAITILLMKKKYLKSHLVSYSVKDLYYYETLILAQLITLTPGTIVTQIDRENNLLYLHFLNAANPDEVIKEINNGIKQALLGVTR